MKYTALRERDIEEVVNQPCKVRAEYEWTVVHFHLSEGRCQSCADLVVKTVPGMLGNLFSAQWRRKLRVWVILLEVLQDIHFLEFWTVAFSDGSFHLVATWIWQMSDTVKRAPAAVGSGQCLVEQMKVRSSWAGSELWNNIGYLYNRWEDWHQSIMNYQSCSGSMLGWWIWIEATSIPPYFSITKHHYCYVYICRPHYPWVFNRLKQNILETPLVPL